LRFLRTSLHLSSVRSIAPVAVPYGAYQQADLCGWRAVVSLTLESTPPGAGEIMGRRREKKEGKRGEVGMVDVLHGGMDAAYGSQYYSRIVTSIIENHYDAMHICLKNASLRLVATTWLMYCTK